MRRQLANDATQPFPYKKMTQTVSYFSIYVPTSSPCIMLNCYLDYFRQRYPIREKFRHIVLNFYQIIFFKREPKAILLS